MYTSGASGIRLGRPIAPDRCMPQNTLVVPANRHSTYGAKDTPARWYGTEYQCSRAVCVVATIDTMVPSSLCVSTIDSYHMM